MYFSEQLLSQKDSGINNPLETERMDWEQYEALMLKFMSLYILLILIITFFYEIQSWHNHFYVLTEIFIL